MSGSKPPVDAAIARLVGKHGARHRTDIRRGVAACASAWDPAANDADFTDFCEAQYVPPGKDRAALLERLDEFHHAVSGSMASAYKVARAGLDIADRPSLRADQVLGAFTPGAHLSEDYRRSRVAAVVQLNFGTDDTSPPKARRAWAERRMADVGREVVPADLLADHVRVQSEVDDLVSSYNLYVDRITFPDPKVRFPKGTRLVAHWGLRDYMMSLNGKKDALPKQRAILDLMRRVVDGEIPADILDNPAARWDMARGTVVNGTTMKAKGHGPLRWAKFRDAWQSQLRLDRYSRYGNLIDEKHRRHREIDEKEVVAILTSILSSPLVKRVARYVRDQLGRDLEPFDVYFKSFTSGGGEKEPLRYDIKKRYPDAAALQAALSPVLRKLGWTKKRADWIASRIRVDNARSAGHAWPPYSDHDMQLLRVRVDKSGCSEISFETYMHELGHCVEGVLSSYEMDYKLLWGVPNSAISEGFAFTFEDRMDEVLGRRKKRGSDVTTLQRFWEPFEIAGPALTELRLFHWLYAHKNASADEIMKAVRRIGDEVWAEYYAPIFGTDGHGLMSVYSHMLWCDLYLADYPLGYVIAYQVRKYLEGRNLAEETERMCALGQLYPQQWMKQAVKQPISIKPLLTDTRNALARLGY